MFVTEKCRLSLVEKTASMSGLAAACISSIDDRHATCKASVGSAWKISVRYKQTADGLSFVDMPYIK